MKLKFVFPLCLSILLGFISAKLVYAKYDKEKDINSYNSYFIQQGVYVSNDALKKGTKDLDYYISEKSDNKYYVYVGITTDSSNAEKIKKLYKNKNINVYVKDNNINNVEFLSNLEQYDLLLSGVTKDEDILSINKVILSSYDEIVLTK